MTASSSSDLPNYPTVEQVIGRTPLVRLQRLPGAANAARGNVILGKLIPAGTGMPIYRNITVEPTEEAKAAMYASFAAYDDLDYGFAPAATQAVPLEEFNYGGYNNNK